MAEFWSRRQVRRTWYRTWPRPRTPTASAIVGAEAFTATDSERWRCHPASIKALGDRAFSDGINRFVIHRYAMQPWRDVQPGMTMGPWGVHYERTQTWWELDDGPGTPTWRAASSCSVRGSLPLISAILQPEASPYGFSGHTVATGHGWD